MSTITVDDLNRAALTGGPSALSSVTHCGPAGGEHALVAPAKYAGRSGATYVFEDRFIGGELARVVLFDSRSSAANRIEEAIAQAIAEKHPVFSRMPSIRVSYSGPDGVIEQFYDYQLPHRAVDAHVRVGSVAGEPVTAHAAYRSARDSKLGDLWGMFALSPMSVLFGLWDSTRKSGQLRIPAAIVGEVIGVVGDAEPTKRSGARIDPLGAQILLDAADASAIAQTQGFDDKAVATMSRSKAPVAGSKFVLGAIPPGVEALDGIATSDIIRSHVLSFSTLRRFGFGKGSEGDAAIRTLLAAMAIAGLARADAELYLRANCHLVEKAPSVVTLDLRYGETASYSPPTIAEADELLEAAYARAHEVAGVDWSGQVFEVDGNPAVVADVSDEKPDGED